MTNARSIVVALCVGATVLACGPGTLLPIVNEPPRSVGTSADIEPRELHLGVQLAALRGQNLVAVELVRRKQSSEALLVLRRARDYAQLLVVGFAGRIPESTFTRLNRAVDAAATRIRREDTSAALTEALVSVGRETLRIESETVGEASELSAYKASVVSNLAAGAAFLFEFAALRPEASERSRLGLSDPFDSGPYRAAYGSLREAHNIYEGLANVVEEQTSDGARAADILFAAMFGAMPSSEMPYDLHPPDEVAAAAYALGALLTDDHGAVSLPPQNRLAYIAPLLEEALGAYESGEAGVADVLLQKVRASLCCPSTSAGGALATELERLSNAIRSGAPDSEITALVEESSGLAAEANGDR